MRYLTDFVLRRAGWVALVGTLLAFVGAYYSVQLYRNLRTNFEELLPTDARSVVDLGKITGRLQSTENLAVLVFTGNSRRETQASKRFVTDLARKLRKAPRSVIASVEYEISNELRFFRDRQALYMDVEDLVRIRDYISERIEYERELFNPLNIFRSDEIPEPRLDFLALRQKYQGRGGAYDRFPDGYYATPDETKRVVLVNLPTGQTGMEASHRMKAFVERAIAELDPSRYGKLEIRFSGGVQDVIEEHDALIQDLGISSVIVIALVAAGLLAFYRNFRMTAALLLSLFMGTFWTFGVAYFAVGYLNANSAFLGSIVIGNGINFGIIFLARYLEERHHGRSNLVAVRQSMTFTATSTWTAALAAGLSYGSLILTGFRGFRQFGIIGLIGMVLCWISAFTLLPAYLTLMDRLSPLVRKGEKAPKPVFSNRLADLVERFPQAIWIASIALTVAAVSMFTRFTPDILETDLNQVRNKESIQRGSAFLNRYLDEIFQRYLSPLVILPNTREEARRIAALLREQQARDGTASFIGTVQTLDDYLPTRQAEKIVLLGQIRKHLPPRIVRRLSESDRAQIDQFLNPAALVPISERDLPALLLDKFTEKDGSRGKLVLVEPPMGGDITSNGQKLLSFIRNLRATADSLVPGVPIAGTLTVSSDMILSISRDGPKATLFAFVAVVLLVAILFRNFQSMSLVLFSLFLGVIWLAGIILGFSMKINFLNFIALPITFGIGVDYGVNIFQRYREEGVEQILRVIRSTGGAVGLCSFTTIVGFGSLLIAGNQGFVSFGALAVAGELTCVTAAVISLPAFLRWMHLRKAPRPLRGSSPS
ncbi:MAG: MMPL family transporter [Oligoflexia bacterium]|nr:MMPL family transporter [Oligoflexia bacterium]